MDRGRHTLILARWLCLGLLCFAVGAWAASGSDDDECGFGAVAGEGKSNVKPRTWKVEPTWVHQGHDLGMLKSILDMRVKDSGTDLARSLERDFELFPELSRYGLAAKGNTPAQVTAARELVLSHLAIVNQLNRFQLAAVNRGIEQAVKEEQKQDTTGIPYQVRIDSLRRVRARANSFPPEHAQFIVSYLSIVEKGAPISPYVVDYAQRLEQMFPAP